MKSITLIITIIITTILTATLLSEWRRQMGAAIDYDSAGGFRVVSKEEKWSLFGATVDNKTTILFWLEGDEKISIEIESGKISLGLVKVTPEGRKYLIDRGLSGEFSVLAKEAKK